jgi:4-amino-4-deoxy-L-arabinose transferase-like glycosyltransferase
MVQMASILKAHNGLRQRWYSRVIEERLLVATLVILGLPIFLLGLRTPALYDPHESLYAEIAREMLVRGDWLTPHLNDARYLDKPPLLYWLIGLSYKALGVSAFSARLPVAIAGVGGVLVTWGIGRQLCDGRFGFVAGLVLTASIGYFVFSRQLLPDMVLSCFTTLSFYCVLRSFAPARSQRLWALLFYVSLALAVLTKGFLGLFPLGVVVFYLVLIGKLRLLRAMMPLWGGGLFIMLTAPWHLIIAWQNEGYLWHYVMNEHVLRFLGQREPVDYISLPLPIFVLVLFLWLLPWSPYLALMLPTGLLQRKKELPPQEQGSLFLWLWAGALLVFFAASQARLPQYSLPAMPALALLLGKSLDDRLRGHVTSTRGLLRATAVSLLMPAFALLLIPAYIDRYHHVGLTDQTAVLIRAIFGLMMGGSGLALLGFCRRRWLVGLLTLALGMMAAFPVVHHVLVLLEPWRSSKALVALIRADHGLGQPIVLEVEKDQPFEYETVAGLVFYARQPVDLLRRKSPPKPSLPLKPGERFLLSEAEFRQRWSSRARVYLVTDSFLDGDGIVDHGATFSVVGHVGNRWVLSNQP